jgi:hypothetical protein
MSRRLAALLTSSETMEEVPVLDVTLMNFEIALFDSIVFDPAEAGLDERRTAENAELAGILATSLLDRDAVPPHRLDYLRNAAHAAPGDVSIMEGWTRDGLDGEVLHKDARFLKYLRYMICGPDLPQPVIKGFVTEVENRTPEGEIDARKVMLKVRELARKAETPSQRAEEFYMLALECDLEPALARDIRAAVARMK